MNEYNSEPLNKVKRGAKRASYDKSVIDKIIDSGFIGYVSYAFEGQPICLPMAYGRIGNKIYLHGSKKNRMLLALLQAEKASMTIMHLDGLVLARSGFHHSVNYRSVTLFGSLEIVSNHREKAKALKCVVDSMIEGRWEKLRPMNQKELDGTLVVEMTIETGAAKIRNEGAIDEKADIDLPIWAGVVPIKQIAGLPVSDTSLPEGVEIPEHVMQYYQKHK